MSFVHSMLPVVSWSTFFVLSALCKRWYLKRTLFGSLEVMLRLTSSRIHRNSGSSTPKSLENKFAQVRRFLNGLMITLNAQGHRCLKTWTLDEMMKIFGDVLIMWKSSSMFGCSFYVELNCFMSVVVILIYFAFHGPVIGRRRDDVTNRIVFSMDEHVARHLESALQSTDVLRATRTKNLSRLEFCGQ